MNTQNICSECFLGSLSRLVVFSDEKNDIPIERGGKYGTITTYFINFNRVQT